MVLRLRLATRRPQQGRQPRLHLGRLGQFRYRARRQGKLVDETSCFITSLTAEQASARELLGLVRGPRGIENRVHWVRDVTFEEDRCQVRKGSARQVMTALRNAVIRLLRLRQEPNIAAALHSCAWHAERAIGLVTRPPT
jgi:predicted transposase YbfD/YdcC